MGRCEVAGPQAVCLLALRSLSANPKYAREVNRVLRCAPLAACLLVTACGGEKRAHYSASVALPCLDRSYLAAEAPEGGYVPVHVLGAHLNIAFEESTTIALRTAADAKVYAIDNPSGDTVFREGNVVLVWDRLPTAAQRGHVEACLARAAEGG